MRTPSNGNIFLALLALCEGNPPVTGGFSSQRPVTQSFDVFFDLRLNKWLSKQSRRQWFETPSRSLWRHCSAQKTLEYYHLHALISDKLGWYKRPLIVNFIAPTLAKCQLDQHWNDVGPVVDAVCNHCHLNFSSQFWSYFRFVSEFEFASWIWFEFVLWTSKNIKNYSCIIIFTELCSCTEHPKNCKWQKNCWFCFWRKITCNLGCLINAAADKNRAAVFYLFCHLHML